MCTTWSVDFWEIKSWMPEHSTTALTPVKEPLGCGKSAERNNSLVCTFGEPWATWYFGVLDWGWSVSLMGVTLGYICYIASNSWDRGPCNYCEMYALVSGTALPSNSYWKQGWNSKGCGEGASRLWA